MKTLFTVTTATTYKLYPGSVSFHMFHYNQFISTLQEFMGKAVKNSLRLLKKQLLMGYLMKIKKKTLERKPV